MSNFITRREIEALRLGVGEFIAAELAPLRNEQRNLVRQIADLKNQLAELRSRVDGQRRLSVVRGRSSAA